MERTLWERLTASGVDLAPTLARFGGNEAVLLTYLQRFPEDPSFAQLQAAMRTETWEDAKIACHTLKGLSGNLGLTPVYHACCDLLTTLRAQLNTAEAYAALHAAYRITVLQIQETFAAQP